MEKQKLIIAFCVQQKSHIVFIYCMCMYVFMGTFMYISEFFNVIYFYIASYLCCSFLIECCQNLLNFRMFIQLFNLVILPHCVILIVQTLQLWCKTTHQRHMFWCLDSCQCVMFYYKLHCLVSGYCCCFFNSGVLFFVV